MNSKVAFITGITGQDGTYLAELLLQKGYIVHGLQRRSSINNAIRIASLHKYKLQNRFFLHYGDLTDPAGLIRIIAEIMPDEIYNLAAQSHVQVSFAAPEYTANTDALGTLRLLEAIRVLKLQTKVKFYQASTSELYGKVQAVPQNELTPFFPRSPYAVAKLYAYWLTVNYREAYGIYAANGILFNHESPIRGEHFVTRKITKAVAAIYHNKQQVLVLGNLDAKRDWGHAKDYVEGMWLILQQSVPEDYVLATGQAHTVREFVDLSFKAVGIDLIWRGKGLQEEGVDPKTGKVLVMVDPKYFRPTEVDFLLGDPTKANTQLAWYPKITFKDLVTEMIQADLAAITIK